MEAGNAARLAEMVWTGDGQRPGGLGCRGVRQQPLLNRQKWRMARTRPQGELSAASWRLNVPDPPATAPAQGAARFGS